MKLIGGGMMIKSGATEPLLGVDIVSKLILTAADYNNLKIALTALINSMRADNAIDKLTSACIIFTDTGEFTMTIKDDEFGTYMRIIDLPLGKWRKFGFSNQLMITIMLEEFCHCFYGIDDEYDVKVKVTEIYQLIEAGKTLEDLYQSQGAIVHPPHP